MKPLKFILNIVLGRPRTEAARKRETPKDPSREVAETVVFVVVLVLMLKLFVAEAFVIPTGSMASTLYGDQILVNCPECSYRYPVSSSKNQGQAPYYCCQNCGFPTPINTANEVNTGDRVLVIKYGYHFASPERFDVPVFKYPDEPFNGREKQSYNYIKRLLGLPGETLAIYHGDIYVATDIDYSDTTKFPPAANPKDERNRDNIYYNNDELKRLFLSDTTGRFTMFRKSPDQILTVRRLVFDSTYLPKSLTGKLKYRWHPDEGEVGWVVDDNGFQHTGDKVTWVTYNHLHPAWRTEVKTLVTQPDFIRDFLSYNCAPDPLRNIGWTPDLSVETLAEISSIESEVTLEVVKAGDRFQAKFSKGKCELFRIPAGQPSSPISMGSVDTRITKPGKHHLRLANFDCRLTVWIDNKPLKFGTSTDYAAPSRAGLVATELDRTHPVRIGASGNVTFSITQVHRDIMYSRGGDVHFSNQAQDSPQYSEFDVFYVRKGHYFMLGDNSAASADSRSWGLVPERLMLGKAVAVYWPLDRIGVIK